MPSMELDAGMLALIAQEARQCFLDEDAPEYLATLQHVVAHPDQPDYGSVMRAAHSLKGGAGLGQLTDLGRLAHRLEDLLEALRDERIAAKEQAWGLVSLAVDEIAYILTQARSGGDIPVDPQVMIALETFCEDLIPALDQGSLGERMGTGATGVSPPLSQLMQTALAVDLEECLQRAESLLGEQGGIPTQQKLVAFVEECTLLSETLGLPWLQEAVIALADALAQSRPDPILLATTAQTAINQVRQGRSHFFGLQTGLPSPTRDLEIVPEGTESGDPLRTPSIRLPVARLDSFANTAADLLIAYERLALHQQQFQQASQRLQQLGQFFEPVRAQVQALYDQMATQVSGPGQTAEFDALEMDRYTALHSSLQSFEELIVQVQETRADIDLVNRELVDHLSDFHQDLDQLYHDVTQVRLVPWRTLAQRFVPQVRRLSQQMGKQVELRLIGEDVLIDQVMLEQLQNPLTHLINNAIDHGLESPLDRIAVEKLPQGVITLQAVMDGSQVVIRLTDDGRGIDLSHVLERGQARNLLPSDVSLAQLRREDVLDLIFAPGFSTANQVSDISGRGVGLDSVRQHINRLRGSLSVDTQPGGGTSFTIRLPLPTTLLPLLLCQIQRRLIGIPAANVLEVVPAGDLPIENGLCRWRDHWIPMAPLLSLLPYTDGMEERPGQRVILVLRAGDRELAVGIDRLNGERQLVLKPFDDTIPVPPYLAGCAVLGNGEVIPVLWPYYLPTVGSPVVPVVSTHSEQRPILVAEDSLATRRALERILSSQGYTVVPCRDGQAALAELQQRQGKVSLILSDIEMPRLNGFDLLQKIRVHSTWYRLPLIIITSRSSERHRQRALSLGATGYLTKPVDADQLLQTVNDLLAPDRGELDLGSRETSAANPPQNKRN